MVAAVAPYVDTSISKTVNVPADYPYAEFEGLYMKAWRTGLKGLASDALPQSLRCEPDR